MPEIIDGKEYSMENIRGIAEKRFNLTKEIIKVTEKLKREFADEETFEKHEKKLIKEIIKRIRTYHKNINEAVKTAMSKGELIVIRKQIEGGLLNCGEK